MEEQNKEHNPGKHFFPPQALLFFSQILTPKHIFWLPAFWQHPCYAGWGLGKQHQHHKGECQKCTLCIWTKFPDKAVGRLPFKKHCCIASYSLIVRASATTSSLTLSTVYMSSAVFTPLSLIITSCLPNHSPSMCHHLIYSDPACLQSSLLQS